MENVFFVKNVEDIIKAAGQSIKLFKFKYGNYAEYRKADVASFISLSTEQMQKISNDCRAAEMSEYGW